MAKANIVMEIQRHEDSAGAEGGRGDEGPLIKHYRASEVLPGAVPVLHGLLRKGPATCAFVVAGIMSNLLYKSPELLQTCFVANIVCLVVSGVGVILLAVDLHSAADEIQIKLEVLVLCVTLMDMLIAAVLIYWFYRERRDHKQ